VPRPARELDVSPAVRALAPSDWAAFKEIRLRALRTEPGVYCAVYADIAERTDAEWAEMTSGADHQMFGLFDDATLIGIAGAFVDEDDPTGATGLLVMAYVEPPYRRRGYAALLLDARLRWLRAHAGVKRIHVSRRASNEPMRVLLERRGFVERNRTPLTWPDGATDDEVAYVLVQKTSRP